MRTWHTPRHTHIHTHTHTHAHTHTHTHTYTHTRPPPLSGALRPTASPRRPGASDASGSRVRVCVCLLQTHTWISGLGYRSQRVGFSGRARPPTRERVLVCVLAACWCFPPFLLRVCRRFHACSSPCFPAILKDQCNLLCVCVGVCVSVSVVVCEWFEVVPCGLLFAPVSIILFVSK